MDSILAAASLVHRSCTRCWKFTSRRRELESAKAHRPRPSIFNHASQSATFNHAPTAQRQFLVGILCCAIIYLHSQSVLQNELMICTLGSQPPLQCAFLSDHQLTSNSDHKYSECKALWSFRRTAAPYSIWCVRVTGIIAIAYIATNHEARLLCLHSHDYAKSLALQK